MAAEIRTRRLCLTTILWVLITNLKQQLLIVVIKLVSSLLHFQIVMGLYYLNVISEYGTHSYLGSCAYATTGRKYVLIFQYELIFQVSL